MQSGESSVCICYCDRIVSEQTKRGSVSDDRRRLGGVLGHGPAAGG